VLRTELSTHFGADCEILGGQAGLHLVLRLPEDLPDKPLADAAQQRGVVVRALSSYYTGSRGGNGLVLGYGMAETRQIPELVRRLSIRSE
jgi:GntR family transcriptional regulator/MocR family aminotransferase